MKSKNLWLYYALITTITWGFWGAFTEIPSKHGFPGSLTYVVWAISMILPAVIAIRNIGWKIDFRARSVFYGLVIGFLGAGGQLALFIGALNQGPAYLVFPIISLSPVVTIILSIFLLGEKASKRGWAGIILAVFSIPLLSYSDPANSSTTGIMWLIYALLVFAAWGFQAYYMKLANQSMLSEDIFFYMALTAILLIPFSLMFTDFSANINYGIDGPYLAFTIQILNSVGALFLVYAFRYGKAIIVSPLTNAVAPVITIVLSLILYKSIPHVIIVAGMILALISIFLLAFEGETTENLENKTNK
ncbi:MAG: EamA family transporter [Bacteroidales bacterium]